MTPEQNARQQIDAMLIACGWVVQDYKAVDFSAGRGIALREVPLKTGPCDYLLLVDRKPVGVIEAKKTGTTLSGVADQSGDYSHNLPGFLADLLPGTKAIPFLYESTGVETFFRDERDPSPRSRRVFSFHRPATLAALAAEPAALCARLATMPGAHPLLSAGNDGAKNGSSATLRACQIEGITNLEESFAAAHPRALIQMATGAGKTYTACAFTYRLIKYAGARRVLFLVDRANLGRQALAEFQQFVTPDTGRKFTELYNVQHLTSDKLDSVARVTICTIQRLYSILRGEPLDEDIDEKSGFEIAAAYQSGSGVPPLASGDKRQDAASTLPVAYNPAVPIEAFDFIVTDECHRSIYNLWRQVLEYFDAFLIGLTATPSKQTIGFFNQNLVMEYNHERAVADGVNVGYDVYRIRTDVTERGGKVEKGFFVDRRHRETRASRWQRLDEDLVYGANDLDRSVVVKSQIRTVLTAFKDSLPEIFPGRTLVPKTLIFCKDDSHAEDVVHLVRDVFGKGNDFAKKITYKTWNPETRRQEKSEHLIQEFRTSPTLRIAVTVDMIATGTDIKPLECLLFLRDVRSRVYFEQMKGRGTRVLTPTDLQAVSGEDAHSKTHFVIVDAVGVCESDKTDSRPLERAPGVSLPSLLLGTALGKRDEDSLTSLAGRLARIDRQITEPQRRELAALADGKTPAQLSAALLKAIDPDEVEAASRRLSASDEDNLSTELAAYFNPLAPIEITAANLPHWRQTGTTYFVTFRLADALPAEQLAVWHAERAAWLKAKVEAASRRFASGSAPTGKMPLPPIPPEPGESKRQDAASTLLGTLSPDDQAEYHRLFSGRIESWLDQGHGSGVLNLPECRKIVEDALRHFVDDRYTLGEFVVAANHVHVLVTPRTGQNLSDILHSWKSYTAKEIVKVEAASRRLSEFWSKLAATRAAKNEQITDRYPTAIQPRPVWQKESYDHLVRSPAALAKIEEYIRGHGAWENMRGYAASTLHERAREQLTATACAPFDSPALRDALAKAKQDAEQTIDTTTIDVVTARGFDATAKAKAAGLIETFRDYIKLHQGEITALQIIYSLPRRNLAVGEAEAGRPDKIRLTEPMLKDLEKKLRDTQATWTEDCLWDAFAITAPAKVKGRSQPGRFADLVSLVRFALEQQPVLEPFSDSVHARFDSWLRGRSQSGSGVPPLSSSDKRRDAASTFTPEQLGWLRLIRDHIATSLSIDPDDFNLSPFTQRGGLGKAHQLFGAQLSSLLEELNATLAA